jgi:hypothetical protein
MTKITKTNQDDGWIDGFVCGILISVFAASILIYLFC